MSTVCDASKTISDTCLLRQYEERMYDINLDITKTRDDLYGLELPDDEKPFELQDSLESQVIHCSITIKKLLSSASAALETSIPSSDSSGAKPKLDVPTFDGHILH